MESEKPGFSDGSSTEDGDHHHDVEPSKPTVEPSSKRSYECVFCKRGFTNAQALGGHMNIHRKDRSKSSPSSSSKQVPNPNPTQAAAVTRAVTGLFPFEKSDSTPDPWEALRSKLSPALVYQDSSSYQQQVVHSSSNLLGIRTSARLLIEEKLGSDLSLQIGSSSHPKNNDQVSGNSDEEIAKEIDLELRLGRDP